MKAIKEQQDLQEAIAEWLFFYDTKHRGTNTKGAELLVEELKKWDVLKPLLIKVDLGPDTSKNYKETLFED